MPCRAARYVVRRVLACLRGNILRRIAFISMTFHLTRRTSPLLKRIAVQVTVPGTLESGISTAVPTDGTDGAKLVYRRTSGSDLSIGRPQSAHTIIIDRSTMRGMTLLGSIGKATTR